MQYFHIYFSKLSFFSEIVSNSFEFQQGVKSMLLSRITKKKNRTFNLKVVLFHFFIKKIFDYFFILLLRMVPI